MITFADVVRARLGDDHEGLRFEGHSWSWDQVVREAGVRAAILRTIEVTPGRGQRHVGILLQNVPDYVFWLLAAALTGDVIVGINPTRRGQELAHDVAHTDCDLVVSEPFYLDADDLPELPVPPGRVLNIESPEYAALLADHEGAEPPMETIDPQATYLLLFSSGSTGAPKAVLCSTGRLGRLTASMTERISLNRHSVTYLCLPLFHGHGIMMNLATAAQAGATVVMVRKFSASRFLEDVRTNGVTYFNYVGRVLSYILSRPERPEEADTRLEVAFGSEASPAEAQAFRDRYGCEVREGYGASEGMIRIVPVPGTPSGALGLPAGDVAALVKKPDDTECPRARFDADGMLLNAEEATGEIVVVGAGPRFEGYYNNPAAMADRLRFGGNDFWTGDLAYRDDEGYFYFAGRSSDWVRVDGENFGTAPVENIIFRHPDITGAHAYPVPDPRTGDQLMCAVTLRAGARFDADSFAVFLDKQPDLGTKWRPTFVRVVDIAPTTANGKVDKAPLRATAWEADDVWWAPTRSSSFTRLTDDDRLRMRAEFREVGRENSLPAASRAILASTP